MGEGLIERLKATALVDNGHGGGMTVWCNPDGPEAASRIAELEAKLATAVASLDEAAEYVERFADMRDGDYGGQQPNEAMQLAHSLRQAITDASK